MTPQRGTGATSRQIKAAPVGAYFVWTSDHYEYPKKLAEYLGRSDLEFIAPDILSDSAFHQLQGNEKPIIVDHAVRLSAEMDRNLMTLKTPGRKVSQAVEEPKFVPDNVYADVIPYGINGTGLLIRDASSHEMLLRMKVAPGSMGGDPNTQRQRIEALVQVLGDRISQKGSHTLPFDTKPTQELTAAMDAEQALTRICSILADPKTDKLIKQKFSASLIPLIVMPEQK